MEDNFQVQEKYENYKEKLRNRLSQFSIDVIKLLMQIPFKRELEVFKTQLSRSATAIGANFVEAQATSYKEFIQRMRIALREANESGYWLNLLKSLAIIDPPEVSRLLNECQEISKILGSIVSTADSRVER